MIARRWKCASYAAMLCALTGAAPNPKAEPTFAVECSGSAVAISTMTGPRTERTTDLGKQIYVIDSESNKVFRALIPRQQFDPVCGIPGDVSFVSISPGLLSANSHNEFGADPYNTCEFELSRMTGQGHQTLRMEWKGGRFHEFKWLFSCVKTDVPKFDLTERKF